VTHLATAATHGAYRIEFEAQLWPDADECVFRRNRFDNSDTTARARFGRRVDVIIHPCLFGGDVIRGNTSDRRLFVRTFLA